MYFKKLGGLLRECQCLTTAKYLYVNDGSLDLYRRSPFRFARRRRTFDTQVNAKDRFVANLQQILLLTVIATIIVERK